MKRLLVFLLRWVAWYLHAIEILVIRETPDLFRVRIEPRSHDSDAVVELQRAARVTDWYGARS